MMIFNAENHINLIRAEVEAAEAVAEEYSHGYVVLFNGELMGGRRNRIDPTIWADGYTAGADTVQIFISPEAAESFVRALMANCHPGSWTTVIPVGEAMERYVKALKVAINGLEYALDLA